MRAIIACGGTGGHVFPGLAVAEELMARNHEIKLLVSKKAIDQTAVWSWVNDADNVRLAAEPIRSVGWTGGRRAFLFGHRMLQGMTDCMSVCRRFRPDIVLGMGGFTSAPAVMAARCMGRGSVRTLLHESNAVPGKANRWLGRFVDHVALGLEECRWFAGRKPYTVTGTPIRNVLRAGRINNAHEKIGLDPERLTILVMGGSQGARAVNWAVIEALPHLEAWSGKVQFIHLSGSRCETIVSAAYKRNEISTKVMSFCDQMDTVYSAADLVIARAGASTLAEIAAYGLPSILVPYPHAVGNHQWHNALVFQRLGAARLIQEEDLLGQDAIPGKKLATEIVKLLENGSARDKASAAARAMARTDATERIVTLLEHYAN